MSGDWLPLAWFGLIAFGIVMYVLMDGFVLGMGILFRAAPGEAARDAMMQSAAPVWDGNETWLVLGGAGLFAAFPLAYAVVLSALYLPLLAMLIALVFRGVAFEFRFKSRRLRWFWNGAFHWGSVLATFAQGVVLGAFVQGLPVAAGQYAGAALDWLTPFALVTGLALTAGYALLGATWLMLKAQGELLDWAYRIAPGLLWAVLAGIAVISLWTPLLDPAIAARWFGLPNIVYLAPMPLLVAGAALGLRRAVARRRRRVPFLLAMVLFLLGYAGLGISLWPRIVPPEISLWQAASPPETQGFLLVGMALLLPAVLGYTAYSYWVFRGKVRGEEGY